jgi:hypothetical protein
VHEPGALPVCWHLLAPPTVAAQSIVNACPWPQLVSFVPLHESAPHASEPRQAPATNQEGEGVPRTHVTEPVRSAQLIDS